MGGPEFPQSRPKIAKLSLFPGPIYDENLKGATALDSKLGGWGGPTPLIEDLPDGVEISKNHDCKRCLEFYSGYRKIEISAIWRKIQRWLGNLGCFLR